MYILSLFTGNNDIFVSNQNCKTKASALKIMKNKMKAGRAEKAIITYPKNTKTGIFQEIHHINNVFKNRK